MVTGVKKYLAMMLAIVILAAASIGCGNDTKGNKTSKISKGRYVEQKIDLPEEMNSMIAFNMKRNEEGYPVLYTVYKDDRNGVYEYTLNESGTWDKSDISWLSGIERKSILAYSADLLKDSDGNEYFHYQELDNQGIQGANKLLKKTKEGIPEEITLEDWNDSELKNSGIYMNILKNGNIVCDYDNSTVCIYDKDTYKKVSDIESENNGKMRTYDDGYVALTGENEDVPDSISIYDSDGNLNDKVNFDLKETECSVNVNEDNNGSLIMCNGDGIHKLTKGTKVWETIVDGSMTSLSQPSLINTDIIEGKDNVYYVSFQETSNTPCLMKYYYDESVASKPEVELNVYSINESQTLKEAAVAFQRNNPNIKVNVNISMGEDSTGNKEDYVKSLNTELLSGNGADIILLDGLPVDSYIEKGGLVDMSDIIKPLIEDGSLNKNILEKYMNDDGKIYSFPAKYGVPMVSGNTEVVTKAADLNSLVEYAQSHKGEKIFGDISYNDLMNQFISLDSKDFYTGNKEIDKDKLIEFLNNMKIISDNCGAVSEYPDPEQNKPNFTYLIDKAKLVISDGMGMLDLMGDASMTEYIKGSMASYKNEFIPNAEVGINASSKHIDIAKEFIKTLISEEVQDKVSIDGFPINKKSIEKCRINSDYSLVNMFPVETNDGQVIYIKLGWPDGENLDSIMNAAENASECVKKDDVLAETILEESQEFLAGNETAEEASENIIEKSKIYLEE